MVRYCKAPTRLLLREELGQGREASEEIGGFIETGVAQGLQSTMPALANKAAAYLG